MLDEMQLNNEVMLAALDRLDVMVRSREAPDRGELSALRVQISRCAGQHLAMIDQHVSPALERFPSEQHRDAGREIRATMMMLYTNSAKHVGTWDLEKILADWNGYRVAVRSHMRGIRDRIAYEVRVIYPLLAAMPVRA
jgi:hypothetical protein